MAVSSMGSPTSPKARQAASVFAGNIQNEFEKLRQDIDRKHVRVEKMIRASAQQVAAATTAALQHQLMNMQKQMLASIRDPGIIQPFQDAEMSRAALRENAIGEFPEHVLNRSSVLSGGSLDFDELLGEDPYGDLYTSAMPTDDEDLARQQYEAAGGRRRKGKKDKVKSAWEEPKAEDPAESKSTNQKIRNTGDGVMTLREGDEELLKKKAQLVARRVVNEEEMPPGRVFARKIVFNQRFEWVAAAIMVGNSLLVGIEAEYTLNNLNGEPYWLIRIFDIVFNVCFAIELGLRLAADQKFFISLYNPALHWNILDIILVLSTFVEEIINIVEANRPEIDVSVLRMLRMVRLLRVARIVRVVRFFNDLRVMVTGIKASGRVLLWAIALLLLVTYVFGVTFMQLSAAHLTGNTAGDSQLITYYGTLSRTILTLFMTISGGMLWNEALKPLSEISWIVDILFLMYIFSTVFCCLNIMTGIFVDNAQASKKTDETVVRQEWEKERRQWIADATELFYKVDTDNSGDVTKTKLASILYSDRVQTLLRKLGIAADGYTPSELWDLLDLSGNGSVMQAEFAHAVRLISGHGRGIDIYRIKKDTKNLTKQLVDLKKHLQTVFPELKAVS
ncbi:Sodium channel protein 60E (Drosophila ion channel 60) (Drosophila sodium channel 1) (Protein smell-impaired 60E) (Sodium channel 2) (DmNav2) [Durusdinium trenchii]|uniref:Sodium channel protein 60E (Drosophila ion channel 60) (Drosophila sodium channel 1) (Protein smell-impaired 60E) (Sodium channel 2) (DmNav2) n=1 Tax=Durusdinium trenchii TaxID=1381693 RepID=A0ABP0JRP6_9DINO